MARVHDDEDDKECDCEECCPVGPQGFMGMQGLAVFGMQGPRGFQGIIALGAQGPQGFQGQMQSGALGFQGSQGLKAPSLVGAEGPQGPQASNDFKGSSGNQGPQGDVGAIAIDGQQGFQGNTSQARGIQGYIGPQAPIAIGPAGNLGPSSTPLQSTFYSIAKGLVSLEPFSVIDVDTATLAGPGPFYLRWQVNVSFTSTLVFGIGDGSGMFSTTLRTIISNSAVAQSFVVCAAGTASGGIFYLYVSNPTSNQVILNINLSLTTLTR